MKISGVLWGKERKCAVDFQYQTNRLFSPPLCGRRVRPGSNGTLDLFLVESWTHWKFLLFNSASGNIATLSSHFIMLQKNYHHAISFWFPERFRRDTFLFRSQFWPPYLMFSYAKTVVNMYNCWHALHIKHTRRHMHLRSSNSFSHKSYAI